MMTHLIAAGNLRLKYMYSHKAVGWYKQCLN